MLLLLSTLALAQETSVDESSTPTEGAPAAETEEASSPAEAAPETPTADAAETAPAPAADNAGTETAATETAPTETAIGPDENAPGYVGGYEAGLISGKEVRSTDFLLYGAGATLIASGLGCCAASAAGYLIDPATMRPRSGEEVPDAETMVAIPAAPAGVDAQQWAYGYAAGWTKALQKKRAGRAFLGGGATTAVTLTVTAVALVVVTGGMFVILAGVSDEPLGAGVP